MAQAPNRKQAPAKTPAKTPAGIPAPLLARRTAERGPAGAQDIARNLYRATLDLLRWSDDPSGERHFLLAPLSAAVASQHSRAGILWCEALNTALAACDYDAALDACIALVNLTLAQPAEAGQLAPDGGNSARREG